MSKPLLIKICGLRTAENILSVAETKIDLMGFIFYSASARYVGINFQMAALDPSKKKVGVFVNSPMEEVIEYTKRYCLHFVQLHGDETLAYTRKIYEQGVSVIKVFCIDENFNFESTRDFQPYCEYFLFDTKGQSRGGTGKRFDWSLLKNYQGTIPFFLSGGIGLEHIEEIKQLDYPYLVGIDLNSGVEHSPGLKNIAHIKLVVEKIK